MKTLIWDSIRWRIIFFLFKEVSAFRVGGWRKPRGGQRQAQGRREPEVDGGGSIMAMQQKLPSYNNKLESFEDDWSTIIMQTAAKNTRREFRMHFVIQYAI